MIGFLSTFDNRLSKQSVSNKLLVNHGRDRVNASKDSSPMRLINIIRQSSIESRTLSRKDDSSVVRLFDKKHSGSSNKHKGFFMKK